MREWTDGKRKEEQGRYGQILIGTDATDQQVIFTPRGKWANLDDGIRCPYCVGVWAAGLLAVLVHIGIGDFLLLVLAIAGGQSVLQNMRRE